MHFVKSRMTLMKADNADGTEEWNRTLAETTSASSARIRVIRGYSSGMKQDSFAINTRPP
jgi:hypothetical protein